LTTVDVTMNGDTRPYFKTTGGNNFLAYTRTTSVRGFTPHQGLQNGGTLLTLTTVNFAEGQSLICRFGGRICDIFGS
jgi:hypothetical protein